MPKLITKETRFKQHRKTITVDFPEPERDFSVILRELSVAELKLLDGKDITYQLSLMIVDESGNLIYTSDEDRENLGEMASSVLNRLAEAMAEVNGFSKEALEAARKKSLASQTSDSESVSLAS